jgi:hypothetical protein
MERELPVELRLVANESADASLVDVPPSAAPSRLGAAAFCCMMAGAGIWGGVAYALLF